MKNRAVPHPNIGVFDVPSARVTWEILPYHGYSSRKHFFDVNIVGKAPESITAVWDGNDECNRCTVLLVRVK